MAVITINEFDSIKDFEAWGGAVAVRDDLSGAALDYANSEIEMLFPNGVEETVLNDWLWFECEEFLAEYYRIHLDGTPIHLFEL